MTAIVRERFRLAGMNREFVPSRLDVNAFATEAGKSPNMVMFFRDLQDPFPAEAISASWAGGRLPMVSLEPLIKDSANGQPKLRDITNGAYDAFFTAWAQAVALQAVHEYADEFRKRGLQTPI
jgi:hypothetical protein